MDNCYTTKTLYFDKGLFDSFIDITFVITMVNSPRNEKIIEEVKRIKPTKKVIIVYNSGFKNCDKNMCNNKVNISGVDLVHAVKYIFNQSSQYNNILVLEDDAEFSDEIFNSEHINNIEHFIKNNKFNTYSLGSFKFIHSLFGMHQRLFIKGFTHAIIYSKNFRKQFNECKGTSNIELLTEFPFNLNGWGYYKTLVGQVAEKTENSNHWGFGTSILQPLFYYFTKDNCIQGLENMNLIIKIFWLLILLVIIYYIQKNIHINYGKYNKYLSKQIRYIKKYFNFYFY